MPSKPIIPTVSCTSPSPSEGPTMHDFQLALDRREFSRARDMALAFADPDMRGEHGRCALHFALLYRGSGPVVEALLQKGAQVNCQSSDGTPPLFIAARRNEPALVKKLLLAGADVALRDKEGASVLHYAESANVAPLLEHGASLEARDNLGRTPLHAAVLFEDPQTVRTLLAAGADVHARDGDGKTALELARASGDEECVKILEQAEQGA